MPVCSAIVKIWISSRSLNPKECINLQQVKAYQWLQKSVLWHVCHSAFLTIHLTFLNNLFRWSNTLFYTTTLSRLVYLFQICTYVILMDVYKISERKKFLASSNSHRYQWILKTSCCNFKVRVLGRKLCEAFFYLCFILKIFLMKKDVIECK